MKDRDKELERLKKEYDTNAIIAYSLEDRLVGSDSHAEIVIGSLLNQATVDICGNMIVNDDYSIELIPFGDEITSKKIKNVYQIGVLKTDRDTTKKCGFCVKNEHDEVESTKMKATEKTALQTLIERLESYKDECVSEQGHVYREAQGVYDVAIETATELLEKEKEQITEAVAYGFNDASKVNPDHSFHRYYISKYEQ